MGVKSLRMHGTRTNLCLTPRILPQAVDLPPGAGVTEWFCAGGMQQDAGKQSAFQFQSAPLPGTGSYTRRPNMLPTARGLFNGPSRRKTAPCSIRRALLAPQLRPGSYSIAAVRALKSGLL